MYGRRRYMCMGAQITITMPMRFRIVNSESWISECTTIWGQRQKITSTLTENIYIYILLAQLFGTCLNFDENEYFCFRYAIECLSLCFGETVRVCLVGMTMLLWQLHPTSVNRLCLKCVYDCVCVCVFVKCTTHSNFDAVIRTYTRSIQKHFHSFD